MEHRLNFTVNGQAVEASIEPHLTLLEVLRDTLGLVGTKEGCGTGDCGACTVLVDDRPVCACLTLALEVAGSHVQTVEGLAAEGELIPLQRTFIEQGGLQCGYCTPGMLVMSAAVLAAHPDPTDTEIREGLAGNLCRCTGYDGIVRAVRAAAEAMNHD